MDYFNSILYDWYDQHYRDLPWRKTSDPYPIWVSEIILQQTRIKQGLPYYYHFLEKFPDITTLASAAEDELLKVWEGLGYYSRARNMHETAKMIVSGYNGVFPADFKVLCHLKGVGEYTAAAIASMAYNLPCPAVDGNVVRFVARYAGITDPADASPGRKSIHQKALELLDRHQPGKHNQAMMEFGALQCTPANPDCLNCPFTGTCFAFQNDLTGVIPVKSKSMIRKTRYFYFLVIESGSEIVLEKRIGNDIWKNLYQFPMYESPAGLSEEEILTIPLIRETEKNQPLIITGISAIFRHELTHQKIMARFIHLTVPKLNNLNSQWLQVNKKEIHKFAVPVLIRDYLGRSH